MQLARRRPRLAPPEALGPRGNFSRCCEQEPIEMAGVFNKAPKQLGVLSLILLVSIDGGISV